MSKGRVAIHGHFYQPERRDPFTGRVPHEPGAGAFHDWNERIDADCYRPNAERGNFAALSFDLGPTLASWLAEHDPATLARIITDGSRGAIAQSFHHSILPLASAADRRTEIRWGLRDFEHRFGRKAQGLWLPETAVDTPTLRLLAAEGVRFTILAPWQTLEHNVDTRHPWRIDLGRSAHGGDGKSSIGVVFYDGALSSAVSFDPRATEDADRFDHDWLAPRLTAAPKLPAGQRPFLVVATDGELYGHHQRFRDLFLARLLDGDAHVPEHPFELVTVNEAFADLRIDALPPARLAERTSWSCHHGVARWSAECPDAPDGTWKAPLRAAFERLAGAIDATSIALLRERVPGFTGLAAARDAYVDVILGAVEAEAFASTQLGSALGSAGDSPEARALLLALLEAQRRRLAMFASDGWYWEDPIRVETKQVLRSAARAARIIDGLAGTGLEASLVADLGLLRSPSAGVDGREIYREALVEIGQPAGPASNAPSNAR